LLGKESWPNNQLERAGILIFMRLLPALLVLFSVFALTLAIPWVVFAQIATPSIGSPKPLLSETDTQIQQLREKYRVQLTTYREDERNFNLAKQQYAQLNTLAALEEAVRKTKIVLLSRNEVLETHLLFLKLNVQKTPGIDLQTKDNYIKLLDAYLEALKKNQRTLETADDRRELSEVTLEFSTFASSIQSFSSNLAALIQYGHIQSVYDKTATIHKEVEEAIEQEPNALKLGEKRRAMEEINALVQLTNSQLQVIREGYRGGQNPGSAGLNQIYGNISQTLVYLKEVLK